ncbi:uncharacterized protein Aud_009365 [Aspergillus udagawae]|uniref:Pyranose 2-oxidase n=1 Tax=Aspergillus udagawae TaxID=91492 RepID=A0A8E0V3Z0_9EURO|nr:uncharacterized protein Aud_009365 [Aspergillus udagawae]GIC92890.1 hypothetical protein Aud_009365 [Aspergillus udagawae]
MSAQNEVDGRRTLETDVLIVGSGPIGAVYARTITDADKSINVLMVDMGVQKTRLIGDHKKNSIAVQRGSAHFTSTVQGALGLLSESANAAPASLDTVPRFPDVVSSTGGANGLPHNDLPAAPVVREVGGMGSYWSCATPEQHPMIERSDLFSNEEWSVLYGQARTLFHTTDREFDHSLRHQLVKDTLIRAHKGREVANLPLACQRSTSNSEYVRWTGPATILGKLADPTYNDGNFELKAQHRCTRLLLDAASKRIVGAELTDMLTNEILLARAKRYIICAGAILTTGILFNSHIKSETGYPALGRYLTEQTMAVCQVAMRKSLIQSMWHDPRCREHFRKFPEDPLRIPLNDPPPEITIPVSENYPWHTQIQRDPFHYNTVPISIDSRLILDLRFFGYVKPVYENYVEFSSEVTDLFGMPQPIIHYRIGNEDSERAQTMMQDMINIAAGLGDFIPGGEPKFLAPGAATHICGTTRAGKEDDGHSVVDRDSKVWRLENLFIGGCGVIPTQNACNPTLTAACFAIASARKVVEEIQALKGQQYQSKL